MLPVVCVQFLARQKTGIQEKSLVGHFLAGRSGAAELALESRGEAAKHTLILWGIRAMM
jgi:hypothetical protein